MQPKDSRKPKSRKPTGKLTLKQTRFCKEYIRNGGNGTQAALASYHTQKPNIANAIATENLRKPAIRQVLQEAIKQTEDFDLKSLLQAHAGLIHNSLNPASARVQGLRLAYELHDVMPSRRSVRFSTTLPHIESNWLKTIEIEAQEADEEPSAADDQSVAPTPNHLPDGDIENE